ncbi:MAG TPA: hypothetical protein VFO29_05990 [Candidatus Rubrimentiphilum sp.]|nr:hypothetical protein [Candidatus Rubrimentiphilum sp.]
MKAVVAAKDGPDTVGFIYRSKTNRLYAQARSGMPLTDQRAAGVTQALPDHKTGESYRYSAVVPIRANPWRDLLVIVC